MTGATIHDVAQVVGAGYSISTFAGDTATVIKLLRVAMLPAVVLAILLTLAALRPASPGRVTLPLFVVGFAVVTALNSLITIPDTAETFATTLSSWLLVVAIAALGVRTQLAQMMKLGWRHALTITAETVVLFALALAAVEAGFAG